MANFVNIGRIFTTERLTVSTSVVTLTAAKYNDTSNGNSINGNGIGNPFRPARKAQIVVEAQPIRYTTDGTTPVAATTGILAPAGTIIALESYEEIVKFKAVRDGATDAQIGVNYYRSA